MRSADIIEALSTVSSRGPPPRAGTRTPPAPCDLQQQAQCHARDRGRGRGSDGAYPPIRLLNSSRIAQVVHSTRLASSHNLEGWFRRDVYFLTVMSTTGGYGDLSPQAAGRPSTRSTRCGDHVHHLRDEPVSRWIVQKVTELKIAITSLAAAAGGRAAATGGAPTSTAAARSPRRTPRIRRHRRPSAR